MLNPGDARAHFRLGLALNDLGRPQSALAHLNEAIRLRPDNVPMLWQTAWILATSPDPSVRDGARAVELAKQAIQLSKGEEPHAFDALAAALAETEKFSAAVEAAGTRVGGGSGRATIKRWPTPSTSGRSSTARACRIASRRRVVRLSAAPEGGIAPE